MQVELAQLTGRDGDTAHNLAQALDAIAACQTGTRLLVFPETYLTGFPTPDNIAALAEPLDGPSLTALGRAAAARGQAALSGCHRAAAPGQLSGRAHRGRIGWPQGL